MCPLFSVFTTLYKSQVEAPVFPYAARCPCPGDYLRLCPSLRSSCWGGDLIASLPYYNSCGLLTYGSIARDVRATHYDGTVECPCQFIIWIRYWELLSLSLTSLLNLIRFSTPADVTRSPVIPQPDGHGLVIHIWYSYKSTVYCYSRSPLS